MSATEQQFLKDLENKLWTAADKMARLTKQLKEQFAESARLEEEIKKNLAGLGFG